MALIDLTTKSGPVYIHNAAVGAAFNEVKIPPWAKHCVVSFHTPAPDYTSAPGFIAKEKPDGTALTDGAAIGDAAYMPVLAGTQVRLDVRAAWDRTNRRFWIAGSLNLPPTEVALMFTR